MFIIGIDPHKGSHTAAVIDGDEQVVATQQLQKSVPRVFPALVWLTRLSAGSNMHSNAATGDRIQQTCGSARFADTATTRLPGQLQAANRDRCAVRNLITSARFTTGAFSPK